MSEYEIERKLQIPKTALASLQEFENDANEDIVHCAEVIGKCINTMQGILIEKEFSPYRFEPSYDDYRKAA